MASLFDLLHGLTKVEVVGPDGNPQFYNPPEQNSKNALAFLGGVQKQNAQAVEPSTDTHDVQLPTESSAAIPPELQAIFSGQPQAQGTPGSESVSQQDNQHPLSFLRPSFQQASSDAVGLPNAKSPALTTKGKTLLTLLRGGLGALAGSDQRTAAGGYRAAVEEPVQRVAQRQALERGGLENQVLGAQVQMLPWERVAKIAALQKVNAETGKAQAEGQKATAEAGAIPARQKLEEAQTLAANYKEDPNLGLIDIRTGTPLSNAAVAPLTEQEAGVLGKQPGERVPLKLKNTANEIVNRGIKVVQAGGRSLLVDGQGKTIKDMGAANPIVLNQIQQGALAGKPNIPAGATGDAALVNIDPALADTIRFYGDGHGDLNSFLGRMNPASRTNTIALLKAYKPSYEQYDFNVAKATNEAAAKSEVPTNIGNQKVAFNTMIDHAELLRKAAKALQNGDTRALNSLKNEFKSAFGNAELTDFNAIANAYNHEVTTVVSKGHITDSEVKTGGATMPSNANFATIDKVLNSYQALAKSKMKNLQKQKDSALASVKGGTKETGEITVTDPQGGIHTFRTQAEADGFKKLAGIQ